MLGLAIVCLLIFGGLLYILFDQLFIHAKGLNSLEKRVKKLEGK
jgi:hypothetical protein